MVESIFNVAQTLTIKDCKCTVQEKKYSKGEWTYFICNHYSAYGSGWITEDDLIKILS